MRTSPGSIVFGIAAGLVVAVLAYRWVTAPDGRDERRLEEAAVVAARELVAGRLALGDVEFVDPLAPRRQVGKTYVYPSGQGFEVSGYYRRDAGDDWHAWLVQLDADRRLLRLRVRDDHPGVAELGADDPAVEILR
ncbi:MAG TPA: hypothetical protein VFY03_00270 [Woeseiaceae bacterium]|nr:hypothetical protein [Woeseiaceae bacterium]